MFVFAIETCGSVVALTKEQSPMMLEGFLSGDEGLHFRDTLLENSDVWDGVTPLTARLATASETFDYGKIHIMAGNSPEIESRWYYMVGYYRDVPPVTVRAA
jgi:hypothetical protein